MNSIPKVNLINQSAKTFEQQLARYKSLVFEQFVSPLIHRQEEDTTTDHDKPTILVIEDKEDEWFLVRWALLQEFPDTNIVWASSSPDATAYLKSCINESIHLPQLILVDLYLPTAKLGLGIVKALKTHALFKKIPLVIISRSDRAEDIAQAFDYATDHYIVKPEIYADWKNALTPLNKYFFAKDH